MYASLATPVPGSRAPSSKDAARRGAAPMQETIDQPLTVSVETGSLVTAAERASQWAGEPFLHPDEDVAQVLAPGTARRRALDDAIAEIEAGQRPPLLRVEDPVLADARPRASAERAPAAPEIGHRAPPPPGRRARGDAHRADRRRAARARGRRGSRRTTSRRKRSTRTATAERTARRSKARLDERGRAAGRKRPGRHPPLPLPPPDRVRQDDCGRRLRRGGEHDRRPDPHAPPPARLPVQPRAEGRGLRRPDHAGDHRQRTARRATTRSRSRPTPGSRATSRT